MSIDFDITTTVSESSDSAASAEVGILGRLYRACRRLPVFSSPAISKKDSGRGIFPGAFRELFIRLEQDKKDLNQVARDIEERFLAMGTCVQELSSLSNGLLTQSERLACSSGAEFKARLQEAFDVIRQQLDFVAQCQERHAQVIGRLESYMEKFQRLSGCEADLDKILTPMQTVSVLFKIHAVSLDHEEKGFFATLTEQIVALQVQARTTFGEQMHGLLVTGQSLSSSIPRLKEQSLRQSEKVRQKKDCIEQSMELLKQQFEQMHASHEQLSSSGKNIKEASGKAVMGLQYQDITRQKWEHVAAAIQEMRGRVPAESNQREQPLTHEQLVFLREVSRIQIRQLQAIQGDLAQAQLAVSQGVQVMLEHLKGMDSECQKMCGQSDGSTAIEGMVRVLLEALAETRVWVSDLATIASTTTSAVSSFDKTASDVSGTLRRLSTSIGMIAINAQVQVARIGSENGLDVLSEFVCTASQGIKQFSETVGTELDGLVHELHETISECRELEGKTGEQQRWLQGQGQQQDSQLHSCRDATLAVQNEVGDSLKKIHEQAVSTLGHADFHKASHEGFQRLQETLEECSSLADRSLGAVTAATIHHHVHALKKNYTMESEREVFDATVAERKAAHSIQSSAPTQKENDVRKEEVPVVENHALERASAPEVSEIPSVACAVATAAGTEVNPKLSPETAVEKKPDFGDNVELF